MVTPDIINCCFEIVGAVLVMNHCRVMLHDRAVKGVSIVSTILFTLWGVWNLKYYSGLQQWYSLGGSVLLMLVNVMWVGMMLYYRSKE